MKPFSKYIIESKNTHIEHADDRILNDGYVGGIETLNAFKSVIATLSGKNSKHTITTKFDGSPAVICGIDPKTNKFFVGTKSVFSKNSPRIVYTEKDISEYYSGNKELANILKICLEYLPKLGIKGVLQGDFLFSKNTLKYTKIDGEDYIVFKPNTIVYGVPVDSELGKKISKAKLGIVFHTSYSGGSSLSEMSATLKVNIASFRQISDVWVDDVSIKDVTSAIKFSDKEQALLEKEFAEASNLLSTIKRFANELASSPLKNQIKTLENSFIRSGKSLSENDIAQIILYVKSQYKSQAKQTEVEDFISKNQKDLIRLLQFRKLLVSIKNRLISKLNTISGLGTFIETDSGFEVTGQEGFVAINSKSGNVTKLVDRLTFSRLNFNK